MTKRKPEDYTRLIIVALVLSVGVLVAFQIYLMREPTRIQNVLAADQAAQVTRGEKLFSESCANCHGKNGEGGIGPALNSKKFLQSTDGGIIGSLISSGVPGSAMPAWSQAYGGPFTDEQTNDLVAFIRHWEATATDAVKPKPTPDPAQGAAIFSTTCYACHGVDGQGTNIAPALNSKEWLAKFDDNWFRQTIAQGRPKSGMPTWGKVLSPEQIDAVVAYLRTWEKSSPAASGLPAGGDPVKGAGVFSATCIVCHGAGANGTARAPRLNSPEFRSAQTAADIFKITSEGRLPQGMPAWGRVLSPEQIGDVVAYLESLDRAPAPLTPTPTPVAAVPPPATFSSNDVAAGRALFQSKGCAACHGAQGEGGIGTKLAGTALTRDQIAQQMRTPTLGIMPPFPVSQIGDAELEQIIAYIMSMNKP